MTVPQFMLIIKYTQNFSTSVMPHAGAAEVPGHDAGTPADHEPWPGKSPSGCHPHRSFPSSFCSPHWRVLVPANDSPHSPPVLPFLWPQEYWEMECNLLKKNKRGALAVYTLGFMGCQVHNVISRVFKIVLYTVFPAC